MGCKSQAYSPLLRDTIGSDWDVGCDDHAPASNADRILELEASAADAVEELSLLDDPIEALGGAAYFHDGEGFQHEHLALWKGMEAARTHVSGIERDCEAGDGDPFAFHEEAPIASGLIVQPVLDGITDVGVRSVTSAGEGIGIDLGASTGSSAEFDAGMDTAGCALADAGMLSALAPPGADPTEALEALLGAIDAGISADHTDWQFRALEAADVSPAVLGPLAIELGLGRAPAFVTSAFPGQDERVEASWDADPELFLRVQGAAASEVSTEAMEEWLLWLLHDSPVRGPDGRPRIGESVLPAAGGGGAMEAITNTVLALSTDLIGPSESLVRKRRWSAGRAALLRCLGEHREARIARGAEPWISDEMRSLDTDLQRFVADADQVIAERIVEAELEGAAAPGDEDPSLARLRLAATIELARVDPSLPTAGGAASEVAANSVDLATGATRGAVPPAAEAALQVLEAVVNAKSSSEAYEKLDVSRDPADAAEAAGKALEAVENLASLLPEDRVQAGLSAGAGVAGNALGLALALNSFHSGACDSGFGDTDACVSDALGMAGSGVSLAGSLNALVFAGESGGAAAAGTGAALGSGLALASGVIGLAAAVWMLYRAGKEAHRQGEALTAVHGYEDATDHFVDVADASAAMVRLLGQYAELAPPGVSPFDDVLRDQLFDALWDVLDELLWAMREICSAMARAGEEIEEAFGYGWAPKLDQVGPWFRSPDSIALRPKEMTTLLTAFAWSLDDASIAVRVKAGDLRGNDESGVGDENRAWTQRAHERQEDAAAYKISVRGRDYVQDLHDEGREKRESNPSSKLQRSRYGSY